MLVRSFLGEFFLHPDGELNLERRIGREQRFQFGCMAHIEAETMNAKIERARRLVTERRIEFEFKATLALTSV